jgi:hypothetical protein
MSVPFTRSRLARLSRGSLLTTVLVTAGASVAALTPSMVLAANECTPTAPTLTAPGDNGATADTYVCADTYSSVTYTTDGNFTLRLQNKATTTTGGMRIIGATGNNIIVNRLADNPPNSGDPSLTNTAGAGLWVTNGGDGGINVNLTDPGADNVDEPMTISGTSAGVLLHKTGGAGSTFFVTTNGTISATAGAGIDVTSEGTGNVGINNGSAVTASGYGIRAGATTGNLTITNNSNTSVATVTGGTGAIHVIGGGNATINNGSVNGRANLNGIVTLNNTGTTSFNNANGIWTSTGTSLLGSGDTTLTNGERGRIVTSGASALDFSTGADTFTNAGALVAGAGEEGASTLTLLGLETWNNSGALIFGESDKSWISDGVTNDRISAAGALFTGSGDSLLIMDVDLSANQADCTAAITADCLDLRGGSTAGSTSILVNVVDTLATAERVVLVDVAGAGTSAAGDFTLNEDSSGYRQIGTRGAVESGLFFYTLDYDATAKQHVLQSSAFGGKALELARISRAASEPWRTVTGLWHDRQVDLRDAVAADSDSVGPAVWLKLAGNVVSQKGMDDLEVGTESFAYNLGSSQNTTALVGGVDLMRMHNSDGAWVAGLTAGTLNSKLDYRVGSSKLDLDGYSLGAYATLVNGRMFVDAIINSTDLDLTFKDRGQRFGGTAKSLGAQLEGGYRGFQVNGKGAYIEPLAALSYVSTKVDDLGIGPVSASFEDGSSLRAGLGLRMAGDWETKALTARLGVTGRIWRELDGEHATTLRASFGESRYLDHDVDTLSDIGVAVGLFRPGGNLSANLAYSLKFAEDYQSSDASLSVRWLW